MIGDAIHYVDLAFGWLVTQVDKLFASLPGAMDLILGVFAIYLASRLLLKPLFGMSDGVLTRIKGDNDAVRRFERVGKRVKEK